MYEIENSVIELSFKSYELEELTVFLNFLQSMPFFTIHNAVVQTSPDDQAEATCDLIMPPNFVTDRKNIDLLGNVLKFPKRSH